MKKVKFNVRNRIKSVLSIVMIMLCVQPVSADDLTVSYRDSLHNDSTKVFEMDDVVIPKRTSNFTKAFKQEISYIGFGLMVNGFALKQRKRSFRKVRNFYVPKYHNKMDDYVQYSPLAATFALKAAGVEGHSSWGRLTLSSALSMATMAALVNTVKYSTKEIRPDNSTRNSFPSGHTATAFACATVLQKEYGRTRSPWYSVAGYAVATATGVSRILNNRHWISDVLVGAGVGVISADIGYFLCDLIMKDRGIIRNYNEWQTTDVTASPYYFNIGMQVGVNRASLRAPIAKNATGLDTQNKLGLHLKYGTSSAVVAEGAYYINKYIGVGARLKAMSVSIVPDYDKRNDFNGCYWYGSNETVRDFVRNGLVLERMGVDYMGMVDLGIGAYGSIPLIERLRLTPKIIVGELFAPKHNVPAYYSVAPEHYKVLQESIGTDRSKELLDNFGERMDNGFYCKKDYLTLKLKNSISMDTGVSLDFAYSSNMSINFSVNYTFLRPKYIITVNNKFDDNLCSSNVLTLKNSSAINQFSTGLGMSIRF